MNYLFKLQPYSTLLPLILIVIGIYLYWLKLVLIGLIIFYFLFYFFRVPKLGMAPVHNNPVLSPAYGRVHDIKYSSKYVHIVIILSLFDPHIQYVPYNGIVRKKVYKKGSFKPAYFLSKSQYNERMVTIFDTNVGDISVAQIAGIVTRRIHNFARPLQIMRKREKLGFICFGSRVDVVIPRRSGMKMGVNVGEKVRGGETVLAYMGNNVLSKM